MSVFSSNWKLTPSKCGVTFFDGSSHFVTSPCGDNHTAHQRTSTLYLGRHEIRERSCGPYRRLLTVDPGRQFELEGRAAAGTGRHPNPAAVAHDDRSADGE